MTRRRSGPKLVPVSMPLPPDTTHAAGELPDPAAADEHTVVPLAIEDWLTVIVMGLLALITFANVLVRRNVPSPLERCSMLRMYW